LWLEEGSTALRAGRPDRARRALDHGLAMLQQDQRPKALGELARWNYHYGAALVALNEDRRARSTLEAALSSSPRRWIQGRIHMELGKLTERTATREAAIHEYRQALSLCSADKDDQCVAETRALMRGSAR
jgi:Tfp pilus assembly protein PilF